MLRSVLGGCTSRKIGAGLEEERIISWLPGNVRFGSLADYFPDITSTAAFGGKADLLHLSMRGRNIDTA